MSHFFRIFHQLFLLNGIYGSSSRSTANRVTSMGGCHGTWPILLHNFFFPEYSRDGGLGTIIWVAVSTEHRGKGIGKLLCMRAEIEYKNRGAHKIVLYTETDSAKRFYQRNGYVLEGTHPVPSGLPGYLKKSLWLNRFSLFRKIRPLLNFFLPADSNMWFCLVRQVLINRSRLLST